MEHEIEIDKDIISLTTKTVEFLLSKNPDSLSLYLFYTKNAKIQKTNQIWNTDTFGMKGLGWGSRRYYCAKEVLLESGLLTLIKGRNEDGTIDKSYIRLNYIHSSQKPDVDTSTRGERQTNALSNKREMLKVIKSEASSQNDLTPDTSVKAKPVDKLPDYLGRTTLTRLLRVYSLLWQDKYGQAPTVIAYGKAGGLLKPIIQAYTEYQIACLLKIHFSWHGTTGDDDFVYKQMSNRGFSLTDFRKNVDLYIAYLTNALHIEYTNPDSVRQFAVKSLGVIIKRFKDEKGIK